MGYGNGVWGLSYAATLGDLLFLTTRGRVTQSLFKCKHLPVTNQPMTSKMNGRDERPGAWTRGAFEIGAYILPWHGNNYRRREHVWWAGLTAWKTNAIERE
jgi:hypothetical protein